MKKKFKKEQTTKKPLFAEFLESQMPDEQTKKIQGAKLIHNGNQVDVLIVD